MSSRSKDPTKLVIEPVIGYRSWRMSDHPLELRGVICSVRWPYEEDAVARCLPQSIPFASESVALPR
jgi:hypothetical protein